MKFLSDTFWEKVDVKGPDDCWNWKIANHDSYPIVKINSTCYPANRIAWILSGKSIEAGRLILHTCDNKKCVNPKHLYMGTFSDNMIDRCNRFKGRIGKIGRFSKEDIAEMRKLFNNNTPRQEIMNSFNVSRRYLYKLVSGEMGVNSI